MGARARRFLGVKLGAEVGACVGAGAGRFMRVRCSAGVGDCLGAEAEDILGSRRGAGVGGREGDTGGAGGGSLGVSGCLQPRLPGTGGGISTGPTRGLAGARSRT